MITTFIYKGAIIETPNLEKKLKRMKLTLLDIQVIDNIIKHTKVNDSEPDESIIINWFYNKKTQEKIGTITNTLEHLVFNNTTKIGIRNFNINDWKLL